MKDISDLFLPERYENEYFRFHLIRSVDFEEGNVSTGEEFMLNRDLNEK